MPESDQPNPSTAAPLPGAPVCQRCGKPMRLVSSEPHPRYINLDARDYSCDCGENAGNFVARADQS